jgi:DnaK suppressor protein
VPLSEDALAQSRQRLESELAEIEKELAELGAEADGSIRVSLDEGFADAAQATSERAKMLSFVEGLIKHLHDVQAALGRVDRGSYGQCERCGNQIGPERLEAVPTARLCISCAQKR